MNAIWLSDVELDGVYEVMDGLLRSRREPPAPEKRDRLLKARCDIERTIETLTGRVQWRQCTDAPDTMHDGKRPYDLLLAVISAQLKECEKT